MRRGRLGFIAIIALTSACASAPAPFGSGKARAVDAREVSAPALGDVSIFEDLIPPNRVAAPTPRPSSRPVAPITALTAANAEARRAPHPDAFVDATQIYDYAPGALYEVYATPGYLSTILLEPGETIVTVAAGDTSRWMVEETLSGALSEPRYLLLIKPLRAGIRTNIVLATDRRTYLIEAIALEGRAYSAQTAWRYQSPPAPAGDNVAPHDLNFGYRIETVRGRTPRWRPVRVFDDGRRTYVDFPLDIASSEAPPLFLRDGNDIALVNYRVIANRYVIDRLFDVAELRLGAPRQTVVRIRREGAAPIGQDR